MNASLIQTADETGIAERYSANAEWLYAKIFWSGDLDTLLLDRVVPWINRLHAQGFSDRFFFVRYWERGQHLRVRWRLTAGASQRALQCRLTKWFAFESDSSSPDAPSVEFDAYVRETLRYGGPEQMDRAESYFDASSRVTLALLPGCKTMKSYRITAAIELLLLQLIAAGLSVTQCTLLCKCSLLMLQQHCSKADAQYVLDSYHHKWTANQACLTNFVNGVMSKNYDQSPLHSWMDFCRQYWTELYEKAASGDLPSLPIQPAQEGSGSEVAREWGQVLGFSWDALVGSLAPYQRQVLPILLSQIHMTNNRLGVAKLCEPFVGYLIARSLERLCQA
jgi:thiopeptide-type bacteriocin biosynthesis protein